MNNLNVKSYFNNTKHKDLLKKCKKGAIERIKYNFINNVIKPNLLDINLDNSIEQYLKLLTLIYNFSSYEFYYFLDTIQDLGFRKKKRNTQIKTLRSQVVEWIEFNKKKGIDSFYYIDNSPKKIEEFKQYMIKKKLNYDVIIIFLNFMNNKEPYNVQYISDISRQLNLFIFSIIRFQRYGLSNIDNSGKKAKWVNSFSYKKGDLKKINFDDFIYRNISTGLFISTNLLPSSFMSNITDKSEPFIKAINNSKTIDLLHDLVSKKINIGLKSIIGGIHKPILEINSMFEPTYNGKVHVTQKMSIKRNYEQFKVGDIVRVYATQNKVSPTFIGKLEARSRGAYGNTYGGHMAIEIEHFYIMDGERKSELYSFGFASGAYLEEDFNKKGWLDSIISKIPVLGSKIDSLGKLKGGTLYTPDYPLLGKMMAQINISDRAPKFNYIKLIGTGLLNSANLSKLREHLDNINIDQFCGSKIYHDTINIKNINDYLNKDELKIINENNIKNQQNLGNLKFTDNLNNLNDDKLLEFLKCNTFFINTLTYYWDLGNIYCEMTHRDASMKNIPIYNCTSWADTVFDDIIDCDKSKLTSAPDRCSQSKSYPFKGCDVNGEILFNHNGEPFGPNSKIMKRLMKESKKKMARSSYLTRLPRNFYSNNTGIGKKKKSKTIKKKKQTLKKGI